MRHLGVAVALCLVGGPSLAACGGSPSISPAGPPDADNPVVSAPPQTDLSKHFAALDHSDRKMATLEVSSGTTALTVRTATPGDELHDDLIHATTPAGSKQRPVIADSVGGLQLTLQDLPDATGVDTGVLDVRLDPAVIWTIRLAGGASSERLDLRSGQVALVEFAAGVSHAEVRLPEPQGTQRVRLEGGASLLTVLRPADVPVKAIVAGGAGSVELDGERHSGVPGNTSYTGRGYARATNRLDIELGSGVSDLVVDRE